MYVSPNRDLTFEVALVVGLAVAAIGKKSVLGTNEFWIGGGGHKRSQRFLQDIYRYYFFVLIIIAAVNKDYKPELTRFAFRSRMI